MSNFIQDFEPVIFNKTNKQNQHSNNNNQKKYQSGKNIQNKSDVDMRKIDREEIKLATASLDMKKAIQQARCNKKLTQEDLAKLCCLPKEVIRDYENGKAIVKQAELSKINKALGINLRKPKNIKINNQ